MSISDEEMIGKKFNRLLVIEKSNIKNRDNKYLWKCLCDCQKDKPENEIEYTYATKTALIRGLTPGLKGQKKSCGCLHKEQSSINGKKNKKCNEYDLKSNSYGVGWTESGYEFYFDLSDYDLIKEYCWHKHIDGYLRTCCEIYKDENGKIHNKYIMMHQLIMGENECDHIDGNPANNRRYNLRYSDHNKNMKNLKKYSNNRSGHKGVVLYKDKWSAYIQVDKQKIHLGFFDTYEEAVVAREKAEKQYFKEYNREEQFL